MLSRLPNDPKVAERNRILNEIRKYIEETDTRMQASRVYNTLHRNLYEVYTKKEFIEFFSDDFNHVYGLGAKSIQQIRDFFNITEVKVVDNKTEIRERNKLIYREYLLGRNSMHDISKRYNLPYSQVRVIINTFKTNSRQRDEFLSTMVNYLIGKKKLDAKSAFNVYHHITMYFLKDDKLIETTEADIIKEINSDKYIAGISNYTRTILREFVSSIS